ncbi:hypothetical protein QCA50_016129 [Cerrena zonata]|uniref:Uncharacterized protein n=1 Tax=Cerrena zonata TaxID=2478898 RepID=A0AAW0FMP6_9APHY
MASLATLPSGFLNLFTSEQHAALQLLLAGQITIQRDGPQGNPYPQLRGQQSGPNTQVPSNRRGPPTRAGSLEEPSTHRRREDPAQTPDGVIDPALRAVTRPEPADDAALSSEGERDPSEATQSRRLHARVRGRGASTAVKRAHLRARRQSPSDGDEADDEADHIGPLKDLDDLNLVSLLAKSGTLSKKHKEYKNEISRDARMVMRELVGITPKDPWPRWSEGMTQRKDSSSGLPLLTPHFEGAVNHPVNANFLRRVAKKVCEQYKTEDGAPSFIRDKTIRVDYKTVYTLAQKSWSGFKKVALAQWDQEKAAKEALRSAEARREARRFEKSTRLQGAAKRYQELYDFDPTDLVAKEWLSDELSGPEHGSGETHEEWQTRVIQATSFKDEPAVREQIKFLEVVKPAWRSKKYQTMIEKLYDLWWESLSATDKFNRHFRVRTKRVYNASIPKAAPWDFMIDGDWYAANCERPDNQFLLADWMTYGNPEGYLDPDAEVNPDAEATGEGAGEGAEGDAAGEDAN